MLFSFKWKGDQSTNLMSDCNETKTLFINCRYLKYFVYLYAVSLCKHPEHAKYVGQHCVGAIKDKVLKESRCAVIGEIGIECTDTWAVYSTVLAYILCTKQV